MDVTHLHLESDEAFPNSPLPILVYRDAIHGHGPDLSDDIERCFARNRWEGIWRNGIFDFHHFHASAHEVLGCARGTVRVQLGGPNGQEITLSAGDVVVLPAGTAHKNLGHSDDYRTIGAYPPNQSPDMCYGEPGEQPQAEIDIANVRLPKTDPVFGEHGPLRDAWNR